MRAHQPPAYAGSGKNRLPPALMTRRPSLLAEALPDRGDILGRSRNRAAMGQARSGVLGQSPDLTAVRGSQTVLGASGQAEGYEGAYRPCRCDRMGQAS